MSPVACKLQGFCILAKTGSQDSRMYYSLIRYIILSAGQFFQPYSNSFK